MESKLQIISGRFRGRKLYLPRDARPTQNRARAALFNMLSSGLLNYDEPFNVWDAFAGSGAFGIECLSRYPNARVVFTDVASGSMDVVRRNLALLNIDSMATTEQIDAVFVVKKYGPTADLIFVDPPYEKVNLGYDFIRLLTKRSHNGAILVWEQEITNMQDSPTGWTVLRDKKYGRARFLILRRDQE